MPKKPKTAKSNTTNTNAVCLTNIKVAAEASSMSMGTLYQTMAHSSGLMFENSVGAQNNLNLSAQAVTNQGVLQMYSFVTVTDAIAMAQMTKANTKKT